MSRRPTPKSKAIIDGDKNSDLRTPQEVSGRLRVAPKTLAMWRSTGRVRLPFLKLGGMIRYRAADVESFLAENLRTSDA